VNFHGISETLTDSNIERIKLHSQYVCIGPKGVHFHPIDSPKKKNVIFGNSISGYIGALTQIIKGTILLKKFEPLPGKDETKKKLNPRRRNVPFSLEGRLFGGGGAGSLWWLLAPRLAAGLAAPVRDPCQANLLDDELKYFPHTCSCFILIYTPLFIKVAQKVTLQTLYHLQNSF